MTNNIKISVDGIVFGYVKEDKDLKILLIKRLLEPFANSWALPGGFVLENETLENAVLRELKEESGLKDKPYLEQLYTFGDIDRDPRSRVISVSYYGLINTTILEASSDALEAKWFSIKNLPSFLAFDHRDIIETALNRLKSKIIYQPIGLELLVEKFSLADIHKLYETILDKDIDRRNFQKKFLKLDILDDLNEKSEGVGRPAKLYSFNKEKYNNKVENGFYFEV